MNIQDLSDKDLLSLRKSIQEECKTRLGVGQHLLPKSRYDSVRARNKALKEKIAQLETRIASFVSPENLLIAPTQYEQSCKDMSVPRAIPEKILLGAVERRLIYLPFLLAQSWEELYPFIEAEEIEADFYVYAHIDPAKKIQVGTRQGLPFYIGKGTGDRINNIKRNQGHDRKINNLLKNYKQEQVIIKLFSSLTEQEAFEIEAKLIYLFGSLYDPTRSNSYLTNLQIPGTPEFIEEYPIFLT